MVGIGVGGVKVMASEEWNRLVVYLGEEVVVVVREGVGSQGSSAVELE